MSENLYLMLRKASIKDYREEYIDKIVIQSGLDYRSARALSKIINNESNITAEQVHMLLDPAFYSFENMLMAAKLGFYDIIPTKYFENEKFITEAGIDFIPDHFASGNKFLENFQVLPQIKYIGDYAFSDCINLTQISFSDELLSIGQAAFKNCRHLELFGLPGKVSFLGACAFKNCVSLKEFSLPASITELKDSTFKGCSNLIYFFADSPIRCGAEVFEDAKSLVDADAIFIGIGESCFAGCENIRLIYISVSTIGKRAFSGCRKLECVNLYKCMPSVFKKDCFIGCSELSTIKYDGFIYQIREARGYNEFTKNIKITENEKGVKVTNCNISASRTVNEVLLSLAVNS